MPSPVGAQAIVATGRPVFDAPFAHEQAQRLEATEKGQGRTLRPPTADQRPRAAPRTTMFVLSVSLIGVAPVERQ